MLNITTFIDANARRLDKDVYYCPSRNIRYNSTEVLEIVSGIGQSLIDKGIEKGDRVLIYLNNSPEYLFSLLAIWRIGAIAIPTTHMVKLHDIVYRVENASIKMVVSVEEDQLIPDYEACEQELGIELKKALVGNINKEGWLNFDEELAKMKENPSEYSRDDVEKLIAADIFTKWQLEDEGLITDDSWEMLQLDRDLFPNIQEFQSEDPNIQAPDGCTDIYLFGTPGTGKTCLLMGLTGANGTRDERGQSYTLNMRTQGGPYASALQQYVSAGITPGRTFGKFVTTINGQVNEVDKRGNILNHRINLVEMSGEEFALRIADSKEVSLANMGTGATNLLSNDNRKVFFIIVDSSKEKVKVEYIEQVKDAEGNVIDERIRKKYIWQLDILNKFVGLFELPENQEIMKRVDAIHFVVTKADMLGDKMTRKEKARNLLLSTYSGPVEQLKNYCRQTKRINYSTNYRPQVFTFSLGKFYLGDVFSFDNSETIQIVDTIRTVTGSIREKSWWDKLKETIG